MSHLRKPAGRRRREPIFAEDPETGRLYPVPQGGDEDDEDDEDEEDEDDDEDEDEDEEEDDDEDVDDTPMSAEEAAKVRRALKKANAEAKKFRLEAKDLRKKTEGEQEKALREAREEADKEWHARFVKAEAKAALQAAGLRSGVKKLVSLIDVDDVEVDDDGDVVDGLDGQIADLKKEFPELFSKKKQVGGRGDTGNGGEPVGGKKKSSAEQIAAMVNG